MTPARILRKPPVEELPDETLPHNLDAERSVLGIVLMYPSTYPVASGLLHAHDFYRLAHQIIWTAMVELMERPHGTLDLTLLREQLGRKRLDDVGGPAYLSALADGMPRSSNLAHYAHVVRDKSKLRGLITVANATLADAYAAEDPAGEILNRADAAIVGLQRGHGEMDRMKSVKSQMGRILDNLEQRVATRGTITGVPTGFSTVNDMTYGLQPTDLIILAARPSVGKTAAVVNMATAACESERAGGGRLRGTLFSMEMRRAQLEMRMLANFSGVPLSVILGGFMVDSQWPAINEALARIDNLDLFIDDTAGLTVSQVRTRCRSLQSEGGLDFVIIDYLQLMAGSLSRKGATRTEELGDISRRLKNMADELNLPVIALSQLSRAGEGRADPRPKLSDLRESGNLEQDADLVCFLHRKHHRAGGITEFIIEKQRNGPCGTVNLIFERECVRFIDGGLAPEPTLESVTSDKTPAEKQADKTRAIIRARNAKRA